MQTLIHKANERGHVNHGWLNTWHSFSFASWYDPAKIRFGALRVINDDTIAPGMGFGTHPHENMEIITIPLEGAVRHADNTGTDGTIGINEVQVMTAGSGIQHSEFNASRSETLKLLQIWIFPDEKDLPPSYEQYQYSEADFNNQFKPIVGGRQVEAPIRIHQNAQILRGRFSAGQTTDFSLSDNRNGVYVFVIEGQIEIDGTRLDRRDAMGIWATEQFSVEVIAEADVLLLEIPV